MFGISTLKAVRLFLVLLVANMLLAAAVTSAVTEGEFRIDAAWDAFLAFFGGFGSLAAFVGGLLIIVIAFVITYVLSKARRHVLAGIITVVALFLGGYLLYKQVHWEDIVFDMWPVFWLLLFTLVETAAGLAAIGNTVIIRRRSATVTGNGTVNETTTI